MNVAVREGLPPPNLRLSLIRGEAAKIINAPPDRDAGQWADESRVLPPESPEPGPWRTDRVPFWRSVYEAFSDRDHDTVVVVCGAQMGKTESIFNLIGHRFSDGPYMPAIYVGPTEKQVRSISKDRIDKMLRSTPLLWSRTEKGQRYGIYEKFIAGVRLGFAWAGSATELSSHPAGLILVDERDRMESDAGNEGDPLSLARARAKNYANRKIGVFSTPTIEGASPIWSLWEEGTMQMWAWPCLHCGVFFVPHLALLHWPKVGKACSADSAAAQARVACPKCGGEHESKEKPRLNALGAYLHHRRLADGERAERTVLGNYVQEPKPLAHSTASFWVSGLASPWVTFAQVAKVLIDAYQSGEPERIQAEVNTWGGELFRMRGDAPAWEEVSSNRLEYRPGMVAPGCQIITVGADVQKDGIYYVVRGWGFNSESWLMEHGFLTGETEHDMVWLALKNVLIAHYGDRRVDRGFVDSGYRPGDIHRRPDHAVYTFTRTLPGLVFPTKGQDSLETPVKFRAIDYTRGGTLIKGGIKLCHIDTDYFKRWIHSRVRWTTGQPGGWHLHVETTEDYCRHIVAEELVLKASGRATWIRRSRQNHYLDCEVNATAAAYSLNVHKLTALPEPVARGEAPASQPASRPGYERRNIF